MYKRSVVYLILVSMVLHCAGRLGLLNHLYQKRHDIAYSIGVISEIPIAICSSDYSHTKTIVLVDHKDESSIPVRLVQAQEIILYFNINSFEIKSSASLIVPHHQIILKDQYLPPLLSGIFHPPSIV
ncbi:MAG: hypothetical protein ABI663_22790 [Chryseolinea sp.]